MRISLRLNDRKDQALVNILKTFPEGDLSGVLRDALRKFFNLPLRELSESPKEITQMPAKQEIREIPTEIKRKPVELPKEPDSEGKLDSLLRKFG